MRKTSMNQRPFLTDKNSHSITATTTHISKAAFTQGSAESELEFQCSPLCLYSVNLSVLSCVKRAQRDDWVANLRAHTTVWLGFTSPVTWGPSSSEQIRWFCATWKTPCSRACSATDLGNKTFVLVFPLANWEADAEFLCNKGALRGKSKMCCIRVWCRYLCYVVPRKDVSSRPSSAGSLDACPLLSTGEPYLE